MLATSHICSIIRVQSQPSCTFFFLIESDVCPDSAFVSFLAAFRHPNMASDYQNKPPYPHPFASFSFRFLTLATTAYVMIIAV